MEGFRKLCWYVRKGKIWSNTHSQWMRKNLRDYRWNAAPTWWDIKRLGTTPSRNSWVRAKGMEVTIIPRLWRTSRLHDSYKKRRSVHPPCVLNNYVYFQTWRWLKSASVFINTQLKKKCCGRFAFVGVKEDQRPKLQDFFPFQRCKTYCFSTSY